MTKLGWSQECKVGLTFEHPKKKIVIIISLGKAFEKIQPSLLIKREKKETLRNYDEKETYWIW